MSSPEPITPSHGYLSRLSLLPRIGAQGRFDRLEPTQVQPTAHEHHREVEDAVCPKHTVVPPFRRVVYVEAGREFIAVGIFCMIFELAFVETP